MIVATEISFAIPKQLRVETLMLQRGGVTVLTSTRESSARCPTCARCSGRVHSTYTRSLADLPWAAIPVSFKVRVRKLFCDNPLCPRKVFAERIEGVARPYARRTDRQRRALEDIGLAMGGRAGARMAARLGLLASRDTLLRLVRGLPLHIDYTPRVLGVDDWSLRKAQVYGTILVNLERHRVWTSCPTTPRRLSPSGCCGTVAWRWWRETGAAPTPTG